MKRSGACFASIMPERSGAESHTRKFAPRRRAAAASLSFFQAALAGHLAGQGGTAAGEGGGRTGSGLAGWPRPCRPPLSTRGIFQLAEPASAPASFLPAQLRQRAEGGGAGAAGRPQGGRAALSGGGQRGRWCGSGGGAKPRRSGLRSPRIQAVRGAGAARERAECPDRLAARQRRHSAGAAGVGG